MFPVLSKNRPAKVFLVVFLVVLSTIIGYFSIGLFSARSQKASYWSGEWSDGSSYLVLRDGSGHLGEPYSCDFSFVYQSGTFRCESDSMSFELRGFRKWLEPSFSLSLYSRMEASA